MKLNHPVLIALALVLLNSASASQPNIILIFTDDQGYEDLGCFGSKTIRTPNIDRMAAEGLKLTNFYAQPVCGVSRAALMTGSYPILSSDEKSSDVHALFPVSSCCDVTFGFGDRPLCRWRSQVA